MADEGAIVLETAAARGRRAEQLALAYLTDLGYRIIASNHRCPGGEVDLIGWDGEVLCFVEVRARTSDAFGDPLETIDRRKMNRVACAARDYLDGWTGPWPEMRFDAVGILLTEPPTLSLVRAAFETG